MGKVLKILGIVFVVIVVGVVALLIWAQRKGSAQQEKFFRAVLSGEPKQLMDMFDPALRDSVDEPVLAAWMKAVKGGLGEFKALSKTNFHTSSNTVNGVEVVESKGTVNFEKGEADSEVVFRDGKIAGFFVTSDKVATDWMKDPGVEAMCRERGEAFIRAFLGGRADEVYAMVHESIRQQKSREQIAAMIERARTGAGELESVAFERIEYAGKPGEKFTLKTYHKVVCERDATVAEVTFQFKDMAAHLNSFDFTPP